MPDEYDYKLVKHEQALQVAAAIIQLAKNNLPYLMAPLHVVGASGRAGTVAAEELKTKMVQEILILLAEDFDLSPDLVRPGEGWRRRYKGTKHRLNFMDTLPTKKTKIPDVPDEGSTSTLTSTANTMSTVPTTATPAAATSSPATGGAGEKDKALEPAAAEDAEKEQGHNNNDTASAEKDEDKGNEKDKPIVL